MVILSLGPSLNGGALGNKSLKCNTMERVFVQELEEAVCWGCWFSSLWSSIVAQQKQICLASMRSQVQSLASLSGLSICHCSKLHSRSQMRFVSCLAVPGNFHMLPLRLQKTNMQTNKTPTHSLVKVVGIR